MLVRAVGVIVLVLLTLPILSGTSHAASVPRAYAGIVVDAKSGKTLYASAADSLRYPASVTKVMTLYLLFEELDAGRMSLSTRMRVSKHAAAAVPTKLGLKAGATIKVEDAIKALVTLSANDISRVIAEHIAGTESAFAQRMTRTARALGMSRTTYRNASGLPDSGQVTTVRDQTRLGIAIYQHFPKYYKYFQTRSFKYGGRTYGNHNRLLGTVSGVDGIKTGYIRASGYNLLTAYRKDGRHIVVAAFGFSSGASRNAKVASLVKKYASQGRKGDYIQTAQIPRPGSGRVASAPIPMPRPAFRINDDSTVNAPTPAPVTVAANEPALPVPEPKPAELTAKTGLEAVTIVASTDTPSAIAPALSPDRPIDIIGAWISQSISLDETTGTLVPPADIGTGTSNGQAIDLMTSGSIGEGTDVGESGWVVQIGAAPSQQGAEYLLNNATTNIKVLSDYRQYVERFEKNGQVFFRARFTGFAKRQQAVSVCDQLKKENMSCLALKG